MSKSNNIAWGITLLAAAGAYLIWRQGRKDTTPSLINNNDMNQYYPQYDFLQYRRLPRGYRNNNPLNIIYDANKDGKADNNWNGQIGVEPEGRFSQFVDIVHGYRAALVLLRGRGYINGGNNTIRKIITKFAPDNENYTEGYIINVSKLTGIEPDAVLSRNDKDKLTRIVYAMSIIENGYKDQDKNDIQANYGLPSMDIINLAWDIM